MNLFYDWVYPSLQKRIGFYVSENTFYKDSYVYKSFKVLGKSIQLILTNSAPCSIVLQGGKKVLYYDLISPNSLSSVRWLSVILYSFITEAHDVFLVNKKTCRSVLKSLIDEYKYIPLWHFVSDHSKFINSLMLATGPEYNDPQRSIWESEVKLMLNKRSLNTYNGSEI
jgi:hypothetical protein